MTRYLKIFILALFQCWLLVQGNVFSASYDTLVVNRDAVDLHLGKYIRYLSDSTNNMDLGDFLETSTPTAATLRVNAKNEVTLGYGQSQYWLQLHIYNETAEPLKYFLNIAYPNLDHFIVYQRIHTAHKDSIWEIASMGDNFRYGNKILSHRNYIVPIDLEPNTTTDFIFQIKKQWEPINFPLILSNEYSFIRRTNNDNLFLGVFFGIHFLFSLTLLTLYFFTRNSFFILYLVLNVLSIFNMLSDTGVGLQYIWPSFPYVQKFLPYIVTFGSIIIHITFIRIFFSTSLHLIRFNQFLLGLMWMVVFTVVALVTFAFIFPSSNLPFQIGYNIINGLYLGYGLVIFALCIVTFYQVQRKEVLWITAAVFVQYLNWILQILVRGNAFPIFLKNFSIYDWNVFPSHISTPHVSIFLIVLEILVVTIILAVSFYSFIKDNSSGEYRLLLLSRNTINAYIEGQEKERIRLTDRIREGISQDVEMLAEQMQFTITKLNDPVSRARLKTLTTEIESIGKEIDKITTDFVPSDYVNKSFYDAIKSIYAPLRSANIDIRYYLAIPSPNINDFSKVNVCRILQEIAGNISKHAQATAVTVSISYDDDLVIMISDNGKGFDVSRNRGGIGLLNIQSRVKGMNGQLSVDSSPGTGTRMTIKIPMKELI